MPEELQIIIDADVSKAKTGLDSVSASAQTTTTNLTKIQPAATVAATSMDKVVASATKISTASNVVTVSTAKMTTSFQKIPPTTNAANLALINTGRVLQDLPFGIIGVANNINPLLESFQRLRAETGSSGLAIKALIAGLKGGGGLGIAVSAITGALSFAAIGLQAFTRGMGEASDKASKLKDDSEKLKDTIQGIFENSGKEAAEVVALIAVLKSETETRERKLDAIKQLNAIAPEQFNNLKLEGNAVANLDNDYKNYIESLKTVIAAKIKQAQVEQLITELLKKQGVTLTGFDKIFSDANNRLSDSFLKLGQGSGVFNALTDRIKTSQKESSEELTRLTDEINSLQKELVDLSKGIDVKTKINIDKKGLDEFQRKIIALAKEAENVFSVPLVLKFDDTDLDTTKLEKAIKVLTGIKNFTIKARVDIDLPDVKEFPKEQVEKFFKNVPNALQDAIQKGLLEIPDEKKVLINADVDAFSKEITDLLAQFNRQKLEIPVVLGLKGADLVKTLQDALPFAQIKKSVEDLKKALESENTFEGFLRDALAIGDKVQEAFDKAKDSALNAGDSIEDALIKAKAAAAAAGGGLTGITKEAAGAALVLNSTLTPAFQDLFKAIVAGENPLQAFFKSIGNAIDQLITKLIAAAVQAAILSSIPGLGGALGISGGFFGFFKNILGFAEGGRPPVGKPSIVGEKGPELFIPDQAGTIISHEKSKALLTSSIKDYQNLKTQLSSRSVNVIDHQKLSETLKETLATAFSKIESKFTESFDKSAEKINTYTYRLHEFSNNTFRNLKETFKTDSVNNTEKHFASILKQFSDNVKTSNVNTNESYISKELFKYLQGGNTVSAERSETQISEKIKEFTDKVFSINNAESTSTNTSNNSSNTVTNTFEKIQDSINSNSEKLNSFVYKLHNISKSELSSIAQKLSVLRVFEQKGEAEALRVYPQYDSFIRDINTSSDLSAIRESLTREMRSVSEKSFDSNRIAEVFKNAITNSFKEINENNFASDSQTVSDKVSNYVYKLHELHTNTFNNLQAIRETFNASSDLRDREREALKNISAFYTYEKEGFQAVVNKYPKETEFVLNNKEKTFDQVRTEQLARLSDAIRLQSSYKETFAYKLRESFTDAISNIKVTSTDKDSSTSDRSEKLHDRLSNYVYKLHEQLSNNSFGKVYESAVKSISDKQSEFDSTTNITKSLEQIISDKLTSVKSVSYEGHLKEAVVNSSSAVSLEKLIEKFNSHFDSQKISTNKTFVSLDRLVEKISSRFENSNRSVTNNFFTDSVTSNISKSFSLEKFSKMLNIPMLAEGGLVFNPTLAILGERGPEAIVPLNKEVSSGTLEVNVNVNGELTIQKGALGVALNQEVRSHLRTNGKKPF